MIQITLFNLTFSLFYIMRYINQLKYKETLIPMLTVFIKRDFRMGSFAHYGGSIL